MDVVLLSRVQFALTIGYHILWPTISIGTASFVAWLSFRWWRTGEPVYRDLMRFWSRLFAMAFGMGVVTGVVLSYEVGTNWAGFARTTSNVLGPLFMYEALTAFFLEAGFIGIVLFGEGRVSRGGHLFACCMVAGGTLLSACLILATNSWMQTPAGAARDADGIFHVVDWAAVIFSPSYPYRVLHMVCASFLTSAFVIAGVSAFHLRQGHYPQAARRAFSMAMWAALLLAPTQAVLGDQHGLNTREYQPVKLAAMEGLWHTGRGVPATLFAWPDMETESNRWAVEIPRLGSLYLTHSWDGEVIGLTSVPREERPYVPIVFFAFRIMVGIGLILIGTAVAGAVLRWRGRLFDAWRFHLFVMLVAPLGFIAVLAGWTVTETGRQPYVVYGLLRTADAVAPVAASAVSLTLGLFALLYAALMLTFLWFAARLVRRGPQSTPADAARAQARPGPAQAVTAHAVAYRAGQAIDLGAAE
jgi:cytochrome d ubiquinol oxidase subunit I